MSSGNQKVEAAQLKSEKSTDIRQTNIIAAKGKLIILLSLVSLKSTSNLILFLF